MAKSFSVHEASSMQDYIKITRAIGKSWDSKKRYIDPWFRGVHDSNYLLQPGYYRPMKWLKGVDEGDLRDEFERRAVPLIEGKHPSSKWEWYFLMQHYGLPTRLLDWSESSLMGLYFAVADWNGKGQLGKQDAAVWMLDPWYLNKTSLKKNEVYRFDDSEVNDYLPDDHWDESNIPDTPIALTPTYNSRRITAQRGMFTLHGKDERPLEVMLEDESKPHLAKIVIKKKFVEKVNCSLRVAGITDVVAFPEMSYLCLDIQHFWQPR